MTYRQLADELGVTTVTLRKWRTQDGSPKSKDPEEWRRWKDERWPAQGRDTIAEAETLADLKRALLSERGRKEKALASLHELQLNRERDSLIPESEAVEKMCSKSANRFGA